MVINKEIIGKVQFTINKKAVERVSTNTYLSTVLNEQQDNFQEIKQKLKKQEEHSIQCQIIQGTSFEFKAKTHIALRLRILQLVIRSRVCYLTGGNSKETGGIPVMDMWHNPQNIMGGQSILIKQTIKTRILTN